MFRQVVVAASCLLASLSIGFAVSFPSVLLHQLAANDSTIQLDLETTSWIGSIHGLAGIPSILMPALMQWKGRKLAFIAACLASILGWVVAYIAKSSTYILVSESIHGFGSQSVMAVSLLSMSEMLSPEVRKVSMPLYLVLETLGMAVVDIIGAYMHWRTLTLIMSVPLLVSTLAACMWPESPSWLAYKGKFNKCAKAFTLLRGTSDRDKTELEELILAQKENFSQDKCKKHNLMKYLRNTIKSRDFYLPYLHMFVLSNTIYWSGVMVVLIYSSEIIKRTTNNNDDGVVGCIILNSTLFVVCFISVFLINCFSSKKLLLVSSMLSAACLLGVSIVNYCQSIGLISLESNICTYILIAYMVAISLTLPLLVAMAAELMPVKHRGLGGPLYVINICVLHASSLKLAPYLFLYINIWGTMLLYAVNAMACGLITWLYIPETKGKTLQQLEDYYAYGNFDKRYRPDTQNYLSELMSVQN